MTPAARHVLLGAPFDPYRLPNLAARYDLSYPASDASDYIRIDGSNRVSLLADTSGNSAVNCLILGPQVTGNRCSLTTGTAIGTGDVSVSLTFQAALSAITGGVMALSSSGLTNNVARSFFAETRTDGTGGAIAFNLLGATTADYRRLTVNNFSSTYAGQIVTVTFTRTGTTFAAYVTTAAGVTATLSGSETTAGSPPAWSDTITSTNTNIGFNAGTETQTQPIYRAAVYSKVLDAAEIVANAAGTMQSSNVVFVDFTQQAKMLATGTFTATSGQTVTVTSSGAAGSARISGARDLYNGALASQPIYLAWAGANYGYLNAVSGNYFSTPDSAAVSITGDIDLRVDCALNSWTLAAEQDLCAKDNGAGTQRSWVFRVKSDGSGKLEFLVSANGSTYPTTATSSVGVSFSAFARGWARVTWRASDGRTQFFTSTDGVTWTQLGTDQTMAAVSIFDGTSVVEVGSRSAGTTGLAIGIIYRAQVLNGIEGTTVADFNPALYTSGTTFTASTGEVWTANGGAAIVTRTCLYFDGSNDYLKAAPFSLSQPETVYFTGSQVSFTNADTIFDGGGLNGGRLYQVGSSPNVFQNAGSATNSNGGWAIGTPAVMSLIYSTPASSRVNRTAAVVNAGGTGAGNMNGFTVGAAGDNSAYANTTANEVIIYSAAHNSTTQDRVALYEGRKWSIAL